MRAIFLISLLLLGCVSLGERTNVTEENITNITEMNETAPKEWERYAADEFSFQYPANMEADETASSFTGTHYLDGKEGEIMIVIYEDTVKTYGANKDKIFKENPSKAASDLLAEDLKDDPAEMLQDADELGNITTYSIVRDAYVAEVPFKIKLSGTTYTGYALDFYIPERSLHTKTRIIAINPAVVKDIKDQFLLSFRIE